MPLPTLSQDEALVLALRMRDGVPNRVRSHRDEVTGACRYAKYYPDGGCAWCAAFDAREAAAAVEPMPNVIVMPQRWQRGEDDDAAVRRIA
jgi:hypothetical protein